MIGLMILLFFGIYIAVSVWVTRATVNWAKRNNRSALKWGGLAVFIMYNIVFWDFIPTLVAHKYYCATEAGFWVYKTPEQWKSENPGVAETLTWKEIPDSTQDTVLRVRRNLLNERFLWEESYLHVGFLPVTVYEDRVLDRTSGEIVGKYVGVGTGYNNPMQTGGVQGFKNIWLDFGPCDGLNRPARRAFVKFYEMFWKMGAEK